MSDNQNRLAAVANSPLGVFVGFIQAYAPVQLAANPARLHNEVEMSKLLGAIVHACEGISCPVVHVTSAYAGEGAGALAFDLALTAAGQAGKRTLFLNMNTAPQANYAALAERAAVPVEAFFQAPQPQQSPVVGLRDVPLFYANFCKNPASVAASIQVDTMRELIAGLRSSFDMIVLASEAGVNTGVPSLLGNLVDGTLMVIEAERVRAPVLDELKQKVEINGGRWLGAVLNRRRFYIPQWVYRFLLGSR